uniref:Uncharacterized protein n=1 Tax=Anguilla anguilla TaxID=7936 RepID=A0A0E9QZK6_ANGAN
MLFSGISGVVGLHCRSTGLRELAPPLTTCAAFAYLCSYILSSTFSR